MSLKENIDMVKEELNSEEKFFEKAVVTERFVKKYKKPLIGIVAAVVLIVAGDIIYDLNTQSRIAEANSVLAQLQEKGDDAALASRLESLSPKLYALWSYSQAVAKEDAQKFATLKNEKEALIADLSSYEEAQLKADIAMLESYSKKEDAVYRDLALVEEAVLLMQESKLEEAHAVLARVQTDSTLYPVVQTLMHYGVK